jgi:hypothetical protein
MILTRVGPLMAWHGSGFAASGGSAGPRTFFFFMVIVVLLKPGNFLSLSK